MYNSRQTIMSLLPYSPCTTFKNKKEKIESLYLMWSVIGLSITALNEFLSGTLTAFDAQVGENLCQVRAYNMVYLANKWLNSISWKTKLQKEIKSLEMIKDSLYKTIEIWENAIKSSSSYNKELDAHEKIITFLERLQLLISIDSDLIFIIMCFFLTHFNICQDGFPIAIDLNQISHEFKISKYRSKCLTHQYQQSVCHMGSEFILGIFKEVPSNLDMETVLSNLYKIADENRAVLPCYFVTDIILKHSALSGVPILLVIRRIDPIDPLKKPESMYFFLRRSSHTNQYILKPCDQYLSDFCLIVRGVMDKKNSDTMEYIEKVLKDPLKLILANTASHPQYAGKKLEEFRQDPFTSICPTTKYIQKYAEYYNLIKKYAFDQGCSKENQSTFLLKHVFASNLESELKRLNEHNPQDVINVYDFINKNSMEQKCTKILINS